MHDIRQVSVEQDFIKYLDGITSLIVLSRFETEIFKAAGARPSNTVYTMI